MAEKYCYCLEEDELGPAVPTEWCPVHGDMPRVAILKMLENAALADAVKALREIAKDNSITSGSYGPLMDVGFGMGWDMARDIARAFFAAHPEQGKEEQ